MRARILQFIGRWYMYFLGFLTAALTTWNQSMRSHWRWEVLGIVVGMFVGELVVRCLPERN